MLESSYQVYMSRFFFPHYLLEKRKSSDDSFKGNGTYIHVRTCSKSSIFFIMNYKGLYENKHIFIFIIAEEHHERIYLPIFKFEVTRFRWKTQKRNSGKKNTHLQKVYSS